MRRSAKKGTLGWQKSIFKLIISRKKETQSCRVQKFENPMGMGKMLTESFDFWCIKHRSRIIQNKNDSIYENRHLSRNNEQQSQLYFLVGSSTVLQHFSVSNYSRQRELLSQLSIERGAYPRSENEDTVNSGFIPMLLRLLHRCTSTPSWMSVHLQTCRP